MPRKRTKKPATQEPIQEKHAANPPVAAPSFGHSHRLLEEDIAEYPEIQRNEFLTTRAIYPDEFERIRGKKDAWKNQENLAFQVRVGLLGYQDYFAKLMIEFPPDYPKVLPRIIVVEVQPSDPAVKLQIQDETLNAAKQNLGSECVYEVITAVSEFLERLQRSNEAKKVDFSLEEERAAREAEAQQKLFEEQEQLRQREAEESAKQEQLLASQLNTEKQRRSKTNLTRKVTEEEMAEAYDVAAEPVVFDQSMVCKDTSTQIPFKFKSVEGRSVVLRRSDKVITIVTPRVDRNLIQAPQLLLKEIILSEDLDSKTELQRKMKEIEQLLEATKFYRNTNVVDLINYKIQHFDLAGGSGQWKLSILSEYANKGSLAELLELSGAVSASKVRSWARQLIDALAFFDQRGYVHPAVHAGNVLIFLSPSGGITIKLSDGYGTVLRELVDQARDSKTNKSPSRPLWTPPELLADPKDRSNKTCIWELGVVVLEMAIGPKLKENYTSPRQTLNAKSTAHKFETLIEAMTEAQPRQRPTAFELSNFLFFADEREHIFLSNSPNQPGTPRNRRESNMQKKYETEFEEIERLGAGGFGSVFKAKQRLQNQVYAVKKLQVKSSKALQDILGEVHVLAKLNHSYIVRYYNAWYEEEGTEITREAIKMRIKSKPRVTSTTQSTRHTIPLTSGHDFMDPFGTSPDPAELDRPEPSSSNQIEFGTDDGTEETGEENVVVAEDTEESDGNMFGYQSPPPLEDDVSYPSDVFETDPEDARSGHTESRLAAKAPLWTSSELNQPKERVHLTMPRSTFKPPRKEQYTLFIQMELCSDRDLRQWIRTGLPYQIDTVWRLFSKIVEGLEEIHASNIVHRDLKPENIFIDSRGIPKIGDFGLATSGPATSKDGGGVPQMVVGHKSVGVGTPFYTAPEMQARGRNYDSKADMYSLGIMFFEMCYFMASASERMQILTGLSKRKHSLPAVFNEDEHIQQGDVILSLITHDQSKRPTAKELLQSGKIPEPVEDAKVQRFINKISVDDPQAYRSLIARHLDRSNSRVSDWAWDDKEILERNHKPDPLLLGHVEDHLRTVFRRHGAVESSRQGVIPKADFYLQPLPTFLEASGLVLQLPVDLTLPFARSLAQLGFQYPKLCCFGTVYRPAQNPGETPKEAREADFDFVSTNANDLPLKEAEVLKVLDEVVTEIPALATRSFTIFINHSDLLNLILKFCRIKSASFPQVKQVLSHLNTGHYTWSVVRESLRSSTHNIPETCVTDLQKFDFFGSIEEVRNRLGKILGDSDDLNKALPLLARLDEVHQVLKRMDVHTDVRVAPLSNNSEFLYRESLLFQCIENAQRKVLAVGGRYDALIQKYHPQSAGGSVRAVGFRLNVGNIVNYVRSHAGLPSVSKAAKQIAAGVSLTTPLTTSSVLTRCDVLVTSFDPASLKTGCVDVVKALWAAGIAAELSEEFHSLEELEMGYRDNQGYWLVIWRGERGLKVRSPQKEEEEMKVVELVSFLKRNMRRK